MLPPYASVKFIKATQNHACLPPQALLLTYNVTPTGLTEYTTAHNRYLMGGTSVGTGGSTSVSGTTEASGLHIHTGRVYSAAYTNSGNAYTTGSTHSHSFSGTVEFLISRALCRAWTRISQFMPFYGVIAFWESTTPPQGWLVCDGTNGTPDLRDCFIYISPTQGSKTTYGTWQIRLTVSFDSNSWSHTHQGSSISNAGGQAYHSTASVTHTHNVYGGDASGTVYINYTPPYYVLVPIMYFG